MAPSKKEKSNLGLINEIDATNPTTWKDKCFITLDIDWACDEVLTQSINLLESFQAKATWFITHDTPLLNRLKENPNFELGVHPNYNGLLNLDPQYGDSAEKILDKLLNLVPNAKSVRTHSLLQSNRIEDLFESKGLTHECNHYIPYHSGIELKPWVIWNNLTKVPHFWEDDLECKTSLKEDNIKFQNLKGIKVFDFHPIHLFLNTDKMQRYEDSREFHQKTSKLQEFINHDFGVLNILKNLLINFS